METRKIRVCFISPKAYPLFNPAVESVFGGAEVDTYMIATELAKDVRYEVSFIVADYGQPEEEHREGVRILKSLDFRQNSLTGAVKIWKALKQADADIYFMKTASPGVPLVERFCRHYGKRFVYKTAHRRECDGSYLRDHKLLGPLFIRSLKRADTLIAQNQEDAASLEQLHNLKAVTIANAHRIPPRAMDERKWILWVGRSAAFKHPQRFLELAAAFPEERFLMICQQATGDTNYVTLKTAAAKIDNLNFLERVPFADIDHYFEQAKVFVNTSEAEGFPNTFIQACKAGTAILSERVNPDNFLDIYQCGACCDTSGLTLRQQLKVLLDSKRYQTLGDNSLRYVKDHHDISIIINQYKIVFEKDTSS